MGVEAVSFPTRLEDWDPAKQEFYFELLGETCPVLDTSYGELAAATSSSAGAGITTRVFEFRWTIGHPGVSQRRSRTRRTLGTTSGKDAFSSALGSKASDFWADLQDPAAEVEVLLPESGGWRVTELGATVKYLTPLPQEDTFLHRAAKDAQLISPLATAAGRLANVAAPGTGAIVAGSARVVSALAQMKLGSVPQTQGVPWSVTTTTGPWKDQAMAGIAWSIPKSMFGELGGRLSGGVAVIFVPVREQDAAGAIDKFKPPEPRQVVAHAVVHGRQSIRAPADPKDYIKLWVTPSLP